MVQEKGGEGGSEITETVAPPMGIPTHAHDRSDRGRKTPGPRNYNVLKKATQRHCQGTGLRRWVKAT